MLKALASYITFALVRLDRGSALAEALSFIICDTIEISLLPVVNIFIVSESRSYFPPRIINGIPSHKNEFINNRLSALSGSVNPFRPCPAVQL